ncbi:S8 family serine peptidase [Leisingera sp. D0M16]|uniref:S8 family serine peptidase n=1 Tax=Leisingera coralii TaxID=3351347 RepID=UPI003B820E16
MERFTYSYGGRGKATRELEVSDDMIALRTLKPGLLDEVITTKTARKTLSRFTQRMSLPDIGVTVLQVKSEEQNRALELRDGARKALSRLKNFQFAGRALRDPITKEPVLYTENLFVKFNDSLNAAACEALLEAEGLTIKRTLPFAQNAYFVGANGRGLEVFEIANRLAAHGDVEASHPELIRERKFRGAHDRQWHLKRSIVNGQVVDAHANVVAAWPYATGAGVTIAVIDDGVDIDHVEFASEGKIVAPRDASLGTNDPRPKDPYAQWDVFDDHGTACAGVACADGVDGASGVAPDAKLMPIRLSSNLGSMEEAEALYHAVSNGADIISCSWGPPDGEWWNPADPTHTAPYDLPYSTMLALQYAVEHGRGGKGCVILWAAGNGNESADLDGYASSSMVVAVSACNDTGKRSVYSDFGSCIWCAFPSGDVGHAPFGHPEPLTDGIWTTDRSNDAGYNPGRQFSWEPTPQGDELGNYTSTFGGTSSATPGVAGLVALLLEREPDLNWTEVKDRLRQSCRVIDPLGGNYDTDGHSPYYGYGRPDALDLLQIGATPSGRLPATALAGDLADIRDEADRLFARMRTPAAFARSAAARHPTTRRFSQFDEVNKAESMWLQMGLHLSMDASDGSEPQKLRAALGFADRQMRRVDPESVRHALSVFVTHNPLGRLLSQPRAVHSAPSRFSPSNLRTRGTISPHAEVAMDYWREDALANEHHEHWHQVYPNQGIFDQANAQAVLGPAGWQTVVNKFIAADGDGRVFNASLTGAELRALFVLNDRHGELFIYMHQQMLARYDAERLAVGLGPVEAQELDTGKIDVGYHPPDEVAMATGFSGRPANTTMGENGRTTLKSWVLGLEDAIENGVPDAVTGALTPLTIETLGRAIEATDPRQTASVDLAQLGNLHNTGHGVISDLSGPNGGVMSSTETAIRDPAFWRWHKLVDDLAAGFQAGQAPFTYEDRPPVSFANGATDLGVIRMPDDHDGLDRDALEAALATLDVEANLGDGTLDLGLGLQLGRTLQTQFKTREMEIPAPQEGLAVPGGMKTIHYMTHEPFGYVMRVTNSADEDVTCTFRVFLCPTGRRHDPRCWIEMDKFVRRLTPGVNVLFQADAASSVINKPAEDPADPIPPSPPGVTPGAICDCGWPYTLLVPRGAAGDGAAYTLAVVVTDTMVDLVEQDTSCGSMSFCGATDRYPDAREMGYPFSRPFSAPLLEVISNEPQMVWADFRIVHDSSEDPVD